MTLVQHPESLPIVRISEIVREEQTRRWLIDPLWGASSVGVIGGAPKCSKTWLALDMALSVATGTACLNKFNVPEPGPVLVYLAEDSLFVVRERVEGMARHRGLDFAAIPIHVITTPVLRLDRGPHREQLLQTARRLRPRLLLLDPLVRLHGIDENNAGEVATLLAYFRSLQRDLDLSVVLVHHARKNGVNGVAAGQGLRGSSDIHAFGDSNLYLKRSSEQLTLTIEHRAAAAPAPVTLELITRNPETTHLAVTAERRDEPCRSLQQRVLELLAQSDEGLTRMKIRDTLAVKNERLGVVLETLEQAGQVRHTTAGWQRAT